MAKVEVKQTVKATIELDSIKEIGMLKALCQNPHPNYQDNPELMAFATNMFETLRELGG